MWYSGNIKELGLLDVEGCSLQENCLSINEIQSIPVEWEGAPWFPQSIVPRRGAQRDPRKEGGLFSRTHQLKKQSPRGEKMEQVKLPV